VHLALDLGRDLGRHASGPHHAASVVTDDGEHRVPRHHARERRAVEGQCPVHAHVVDAQVGDRHRQVQPDLQHELRLALQPLWHHHRVFARIEMDEHRALEQQRTGDVLLVRQSCGSSHVLDGVADASPDRQHRPRPPCFLPFVAYV
jgi:hypothetical protein